MKKFEELLGLKQTDLKEYLGNYLRGIGYKPESGNGYVFAKGDIPVLLIAHMDTVRGEIPHTIIKEPTLDGVRIVAENSIVGGDDRCGCWMIMNIVKKAKCHVLFLEDEEIGCVGAKKFSFNMEHMQYIQEHISFMIELDRRGSNDCVFYSCDNKDFIKYIEDKTGTKEAIGTMSDISVLMPLAKTAGCNLSCGYYKEHTHDEYVMVNQMNNMMERIIKFLTTEDEFPAFEYVQKTYAFKQMSLSDYDYGYYYRKKPMTFADRALKSMEEINMVVVLGQEWADENLESEINVSGKNVEECWARFFIENPDICFNMVEDFYFD